MFLLRLEEAIHRFSELLGKLAALLLILLLLNVFYDVLMRYLMNDVSIAMQELEWHLFSAVFLLGIPYALRIDGHVRVDLIYERLGYRHKAWIDLIATLLLLLPFTLLVAWYGFGFAREALILGETSGDPGGLPHRWIIKSVIPFAFLFMAISGLGLLLNCINTLLGRHPAPASGTPPQF